MPTLIDSLIVSLKLDASGFTKGQRESADALRRLEEGSNRATKNMETSAKKTGEFFSQLRGQILLMFAAFSGGKGIKQFVTDITASDAALGRAAYVLGTTSQKLAQWQGMAVATGGSAQGITGSINSLNQSLVQLSLTGESSIIPYFRALQAFAPGVNLSLEGANGQMKTAIELLPELHRAVQGMDAARATAILSGMGLGQDMINILLQSDEAFNKMMADQTKWGLATKAQTDAAARLQYSMAGVTQSFTTLGREIMTKLEPHLTSIAKRLTDIFVWFQAHPKEMEQAFAAIGAVVLALGVYFGGPIAAIAALSAAALYLWDDWKTWTEGGKSDFGDFWQAVADGWKNISSVAKETWNNIKGYVLPVYEWIKTITIDTFKVIVDSLNLVSSLFFGSSDDIRRAWGTLTKDLRKYWDDTWDGFTRAIEFAGPKIWAATKKVFGWIVQRANTVWRALTGHDLLNDNGTAASTGASPDDRGAGPGTVQASDIAGGKVADLGDAARQEQQKQDIAFFKSKGWSHAQASGIVANLYAESSGNHTAIGDGGHAYGIAQWHEDRRKNFEKVFGHTMEKGTRDEQLAFVDWELHNTEKEAGKHLGQQSDAGMAGSVGSREYERPGLTEQAKAEAAQNRASIARALARLDPAKADGTNVAGAPAAANSNTPNNVTVNQTVTTGDIHVNAPNGDAKAIGKAVPDALNEHTRVMDINSSLG